MNINRTLAAGIGMLAVGATLIGCSTDKGDGPKASGPGSVSNGGNTVVKVEGQDLAGLDLKSVTCVKQGGTINIASAPIGGGAQGLGVVMTDAAPPKVQSLGLVVDGNALAVSEMGGMKTGAVDTGRLPAVCTDAPQRRGVGRPPRALARERGQHDA